MGIKQQILMRGTGISVLRGGTTTSTIRHNGGDKDEIFNSLPCPALNNRYKDKGMKRMGKFPGGPWPSLALPIPEHRISVLPSSHIVSFVSSLFLRSLYQRTTKCY